MVFERKAKNRGSKRPRSYPPDPELDAFSQSPTCSPPQFSDQPADLFSAGLRPRPLSQSPTGLACQTVPRMRESRSQQAQTASRRTRTYSPLVRMRRLAVPSWSINQTFIFRRTLTYKTWVTARLLWLRTPFAYVEFPRLGRCVGRKRTHPPA